MTILEESAAPLVSSVRRTGGLRAILRPAAVPLLALLALAVRLPILTAPRYADDFNQLAMLEGTYPACPGPLNLYDFISDANRSPLMELGILPWWSHPHMELRFLRPLSSALLWLDWRVFGERGAFFGHVHSLLWWAASSWGVYRLLREGFARRVALIAAFVFAVAPCHAYPLTWMANREALVSTALGTFGLIAYVRWRERRRPFDGLASLALFAAAMLAGEYSLCFTGYVVAIEATRSGEPFRRRATGIACFAVPVLAYLATRHALHYGAFGTGYYHDPLRDFGAYAAAFPSRATVLFNSAWMGLDDGTSPGKYGWAVAPIIAAVIAALLRRVWADIDREDRRRLAWMFGGSILALAPVVAVGAMPRLLEISMIGVSGTIALLLDRVWFPRSPRPRRRADEWAEIFALLLGFTHLVHAPLDSWLMQRYLRDVAVSRDREMTWLHDKAIGKAMVVIVRADYFSTVFASPLRLEPGTPLRDLSFQSGRLLVVRSSAHELELVAGSKPLFPVGSDDLIRNDDIPVRAGDAVTLPGMRARVLDLRGDGTPRRVAFDFDCDLDDPSYLWVIEKGAAFHELKLPPPGHGEPLPI
jgi:hypothetical protein